MMDRRDALGLGALGVGSLAILTGAAAAPADRTTTRRVTHRPPDPDDPLVGRFIRFVDSIDGRMFDVNRVLDLFDVERGFIVMPDDHETPYTTPEQLLAYARSVSSHLTGWDLELSGHTVKPLAGGYLMAYQVTRGVGYSNRRAPLYSEWRSSWILRESGDTFRIAQHVEAYMGALPYFRKTLEMLATQWERRES
jgi:hypothetical protein